MCHEHACATSNYLDSAFDAAGIDFIGMPEDHPGIRIRAPGA
jgi:hypothetical protein